LNFFLLLLFIQVTRKHDNNTTWGEREEHKKKDPICKPLLEKSLLLHSKRLHWSSPATSWLFLVCVSVCHQYLGKKK
jgi:hypothetical protein